jgi:hypothetical protein
MSDEDRITLDLRNPVQAREELSRAWQWAKAMLMGGNWLVVVFRLATRSDAQNRLLHSRLNDVGKHFHWEWQGDPMDIEDFKRLFTAAWLRVNKEDSIRHVRAIDGHGFDILYRRTSKLSRRECADLSEYILAWGSEREVPWCAASLAEDVPPPKPRTVKSGKHTADADTGEILETTA